MKYKLLITKPAENDLKDILDYISKELSSPIAAKDFLDAVFLCYERLEDNPFIYSICDSDRLKNKSYRKAVIKNYVLIYRVDENNKTVYIMRLIYGRRDYFNLL